MLSSHCESLMKARIASNTHTHMRALVFTHTHTFDRVAKYQKYTLIRMHAHARAHIYTRVHACKCARAQAREHSQVIYYIPLTNTSFWPFGLKYSCQFLVI